VIAGIPYTTFLPPSFRGSVSRRSLSVRVGGVFSWQAATKPDRRLAELWLEYNGMYLLWPYARSYIAAISGMSNVPPLTLYTMSLPNPPDLSELEAEESGEQADLVQEPPA
jgi:preprotein translocase subunit SecB